MGHLSKAPPDAASTEMWKETDRPTSKRFIYCGAKKYLLYEVTQN